MSAEVGDIEWWDDDEYDQSCPTCGALVEHEKKRLHQSWHDNLANLLEVIGKQARSYTPPPTYGGAR